MDPHVKDLSLMRLLMNMINVIMDASSSEL